MQQKLEGVIQREWKWYSWVTCPIKERVRRNKGEIKPLYFLLLIGLTYTSLFKIIIATIYWVIIAYEKSEINHSITKNEREELEDCYTIHELSMKQ